MDLRMFFRMLRQPIFAISATVLVAAIALLGQPDTTKHFHHCTVIGGSGNSPHLFDVSEVYSCDEGNVEIAGQYTQTIEHGYVYSAEMGRPSRESTHLATADDYKYYKWCPTPAPWDNNQKKRCGDKPSMCWDGKVGTWDENWQGYSCVTPDHQGKKP